MKAWHVGVAMVVSPFVALFAWVAHAAYQDGHLWALVAPFAFFGWIMIGAYLISRG